MNAYAPLFGASFDARLKNGDVPRECYRQVIAQVSDELHRRFRGGADVASLLRQRSDFVDAMLARLWRDHLSDLRSGTHELALVAVGGYGRAELHPGSDVDFVVLRRIEDEDSNEALSGFIASTFDTGLKVGYSVRTVEQCIEAARDDVTVMTNLLESRWIAGDHALLPRLAAKLQDADIWKSKDFFRAKWDEQRNRHRKYDNTEHNLQPNVKNSPGGLRDIQIISWLARRCLGVRDLAQLVDLGCLGADEYRTLRDGQHFLWRVRYGLHTLSKSEDRLLFDHQTTLAQQFDYNDDRMRAVEHFMHDYYRNVLALREINDLVIQHLDEAVLSQSQDNIIDVNERFRLRNGYMETVHDKVFAEHPPALMELFVLMANDRDIQGVRASTIRQIRGHLFLIDNDFRRDPAVTRHFMDLLRAPHTLVSQLIRMRRYGVLGRYLPEFGRVIGQMQFDLFHIYTVDAHTMLVIRYMRRFSIPRYVEKFPVAAHCVSNLPKIELLYVAGLYHDIAKGRGGDHSELGAADVVDFCRRHNLEKWDQDLLVWLVKSHLLMSHVAQKKDISDPEVIAEFAREVRDQVRLDYLYALTVADINATNPDLWNGYRASLMRQLYSETRRALRRGLDHEIDKGELIRETQANAMQRLLMKGYSKEQITAVWCHATNEYFLHSNYYDVVWSTGGILEHDLKDGALVMVKDQTSSHLGESEGSTTVFVYSRDTPLLFAACVTALARLDLEVQDARVSSVDDICFNTFVVLEPSGVAVGDSPARIARIKRYISSVLKTPEKYPQIARRRRATRLKPFTMPTSVTISEPEGGSSELRLVSTDRPGLLSNIAEILDQEGVVIQNARINTLGERAEDHFTVSPISGEERQQEIVRRLCERLDQAS